MRGFPFLFLLIGLSINPHFRTNPGTNQSSYWWSPTQCPSRAVPELHCSPTLRVPIHTEHSEREQLHHPRQEPDRTVVQGRESRHAQLCIQPVPLWYHIPRIYDRYTHFCRLISCSRLSSKNSKNIMDLLVFDIYIILILDLMQKTLFTHFDKDYVIFISCCIITCFVYFVRFASNLFLSILNNLQV